MVTGRLPLIAALAASLLLAGCTPTATSVPSEDADAPARSPEGPPVDCSVYAGQTDPELTLFSPSAVAKVPGEGQLYGEKLLLGNYCLTYANDGS